MEITGWRVQRRTTCWEIGNRRSFSGFFARWPFSSNNYPEKEEFVRERKLCLTKIAQQKLIQRSCLGHFTHSSILILIPGVDAMRPDTEKRKWILWDTWHCSDFHCDFSPLCILTCGKRHSSDFNCDFSPLCIFKCGTCHRSDLYIEWNQDQIVTLIRSFSCSP